MLQDLLRGLFFRHDGVADDKRAKDASHALANEVKALDAAVTQIKRADDPWHELVRAVEGGRDREHRHSETRH